MQEDALEPLNGSETKLVTVEAFSPEVVEESIQFLRLQVLFSDYTVCSLLHKITATGSVTFSIIIPTLQIRVLLLVWSPIRRRRNDGKSVSWT